MIRMAVYLLFGSWTTPTMKMSTKLCSSTTCRMRSWAWSLIPSTGRCLNNNVKLRGGGQERKDERILVLKQPRFLRERQAFWTTLIQKSAWCSRQLAHDKDAQMLYILNLGKALERPGAGNALSGRSMVQVSHVPNPPT